MMAQLNPEFVFGKDAFRIMTIAVMHQCDLDQVERVMEYSIRDSKIYFHCFVDQSQKL